MEKLVIIGLSTNARHVFEFVRMYNLYEIIGFAVNEQYKRVDEFYGLPVYSLETIQKELVGVDFKVFVAVLWNNLNRDRKRIYEQCKKQGFEFANLISPTAIVRGHIDGDNCWVHDYVVIQNDAHIGANVAIMAYTLIGANTIVGNHCFFGARSLLGGGSTIGEQSFIGINATVFDDTNIGKKCIVGACTAVKRNMPDCSKYATTSDNIVIKQYSEDEIESKLVFSENKR